MPRQFFQLRGCLYGQRTAPKEWFDTLATWLKSQGFVQGANDPCLFTHPITHLRLATVVDDILCRGSAAASASFYAALGDRFKATDPTYLSTDNMITYVGLDIRLIQQPDGATYITLDRGWSESVPLRRTRTHGL